MLRNKRQRFPLARLVRPRLSPMSMIGEMGSRVQVRVVGVQLSILLCVLGWDLNCGVERIFMMTGMTGTGGS